MIVRTPRGGLGHSRPNPDITGYQKRTKVESEIDRDGVHAGRLARRGLAALNGETVEPFMSADWNVAPEDVEGLDSARAHLMSAIAANREVRPCECAQAQVAYDGWFEQANDNDLGPGFAGPVQKDFVAAERGAFIRAVAMCERDLSALIR